MKTAPLAKSLDALKGLGLNKGLGWFSIGLGLAELIAGRRIAYAVGANQTPELVRAFGVREIGTGAGILAWPYSSAGLWARVGGDLLDAAAIGAQAFRPSNPRKTGAYVALGIVAGVLLVDLYAAQKTARS
jgi:hypothetical protein